MIKNNMSRKKYLININTKNILYMLIPFKFIYRPYKIKKCLLRLTKFIYVFTSI